MNRTIRHSTLLITVVLVLALSAIAAVPVFADSGTTPPPTTGPSTGGRTSHNGSSNSLSQVPSGTKVVIVDNQGDKLPLGSQAAQDILTSGDPIWCPSTVATPLTSGLNGCTFSEPDLYTLISDISGGTAFSVNGAHPNANGTIWILNSVLNSGNDSSASPIIIDPTVDTLGSWANFTLTLKGAWNGLGTNTVTTADPSTFTVPISITGWHNAVTISNITISSATGNGLTVTTTGNISLTSVQANGNSGKGAVLTTTGTGTVAVTGTSTNPSQFNNNTGGDGLDVTSDGAITLTDLNANGNHGVGAYIDNSHAFSPQAVTVNNTISNTFNGNYDSGLFVLSFGNITASNLNADGNSIHNDPTIVNNGGVSLENDSGIGTVTINGINHFTNNYEDGLDVLSNGAITTNGLIANGNGVYGLPPDPTFIWVGVVLQNFQSSTPKPITVNGLNAFNSNYNDGLDVLSNGAIKANDLNAANNANGVGVYLDNCGPDGTGNCYNGSAQTVTLTGISTFNQNYQDGLDVSSFGSITAADLNASGNDTGGTSGQSAGVWLANAFDNYNNTTQKSKGTITLTGTNIFSDNVFDGLDVVSFGAIKASNIHAVNNLNFGAWLDNDGASTAQAVTLTNNNDFNYNSYDGLDIYSNGAITLSTMSANDNGGDGAYIINQNTGFSSSVTLAGNDSFNGSGYDGLDVYSYGTITVNTTSLVADFNGITGSNSGSGIYLDNCGDTGSGCTIGAAKSITLNGTNEFIGNYAQYYDTTTSTAVQSAGLYIVSKGSIKVNNVTASFGEKGAGAYLDNHQGASSATVTLTGFGTFNDNAGDGLYINSKGTVTLTKVTADGNMAAVGSLFNGEGLNVTTSGKLVLTCGEFVNNVDYGVDLDTIGTATFNGTLVLDNGTSDIIHQTGGGTVLPLVPTSCALP